MPSIKELEETPRKDLTVFYVLDTSGSMEGAKISTLNHAMEETTDALKTLAKNNGDARLKVAVMSYNTGCEWVTSNGPEDLEEDFVYEYMQAGGTTEVGTALRELNRKLSKDGFLKSMTGSLMPVIIFMTDGLPTDDYKSALEDIRKNPWFSRATKIGFALGEEPGVDPVMVAEVVGNSEAVIRTMDLELFKRLIKFVSVTASMVVSQSATKKTVCTGSDIVARGMEELGISDDNVLHLGDDEYDKEPDPDVDDDDDDDVW